MRVYVLLFNVGTDNEGLHSLKIMPPEAEDGIPKDVVLAFEEEDDATRFGLLLEAQDFPTPTVEGIERAEIEDICLSAGYELQFVPEGTLAVPPEVNVEETDWQVDRQPPAISDLDLIRQQLENLL